MTVEEPKWLEINRMTDNEGVLQVLELPFIAKRTYFIQRVPHGSERGFHAHRGLRQIFFATQGNFEIELTTSVAKKKYFIDANDGKALLVPPGYWRVLSKFSEEATCMVIASEHYDESDYIRNFEEYNSWYKENFRNES